MESFIELAFSGQYKYLTWFILGFVLLYLPYLYKRHRDINEKARIHKHENPDAIKVYIEKTRIDDIMTIHSVNGEKPIFFSEGLKQVFYIKSGRNIIAFECTWSKKSITALGGYNNYSGGYKEFDVEIEKDKDYELYYDHDAEKYIFKERI